MSLRVFLIFCALIALSLTPIHAENKEKVIYLNEGISIIRTDERTVTGDFRYYLRFDPADYPNNHWFRIVMVYKVQRYLDAETTQKTEFPSDPSYKKRLGLEWSLWPERWWITPGKTPAKNTSEIANGMDLEVISLTVTDMGKETPNSYIGPADVFGGTEENSSTPKYIPERQTLYKGN